MKQISLSPPQLKLLKGEWDTAFDEPIKNSQLRTALSLEKMGIIRVEKNYKWLSYGKAAKHHIHITSYGIELCFQLFN